MDDARQQIPGAYSTSQQGSTFSYPQSLDDTRQQISGAYSTSQQGGTQQFASGGTQYFSDGSTFNVQGCTINEDVEEVLVDVIMYEGEEYLVSESVETREITVRKRITYQDIYERDEIVEVSHTVQDIVENIARERIREEIRERRKTKYNDVRIRADQKEGMMAQHPDWEVFEDNVREVKIVEQDREVPMVEIRDRIIEVEKVVEVPVVKEEIKFINRPVPQYVDKVVYDYVDVPVYTDEKYKVPRGVEVVTTCEYQMPKLVPRVKKVPYTVYVPRFIEVPVHAELLEAGQFAQMEMQNAKVQGIAVGEAVSLCDVEKLAEELRAADVLHSLDGYFTQNAWQMAWQEKTKKAWEHVTFPVMDAATLKAAAMMKRNSYASHRKASRAASSLKKKVKSRR